MLQCSMCIFSLQLERTKITLLKISNITICSITTLVKFLSCFAILYHYCFVVLFCCLFFFFIWGFFLFKNLYHTVIWERHCIYVDEIHSTQLGMTFMDSVPFLSNQCSLFLGMNHTNHAFSHLFILSFKKQKR